MMLGWDIKDELTASPGLQRAWGLHLAGPRQSRPEQGKVLRRRTACCDMCMGGDVISCWSCDCYIGVSSACCQESDHVG